ncbi:hypothetical protein E4T56_gene348 [Termitomyces sp. T112]|nr:hypothetical protein E4T56_gene348 [Termitomyces sp. T112]
MSSPSNLSQWTSKRIPEEHSDSSGEFTAFEGVTRYGLTELDNLSTETEMGNNLSPKYNRDLVIAALDAIPDMPLKHSPALEGPSSASKPAVNVSIPSKSVRSSQQSATSQPSSNRYPMDDASGSRCNPPKDVGELQTTNLKEHVPISKDKEKSIDGQSQDQILPSTELLSSHSKVINNGLTLALTSPSISTFRQPFKSPFLTPLPQQFPLSPPCLSQTLSPSALEHNSSDKSNDSEIDDLPDIEQLIALTQPNPPANPSRRKIKRPVSSGPHINSRPTSPMVPVKRQMSDSPRISSPPPPKKRRMNEKMEMPMQHLEILDSSSDGQLLKITQAPDPKPSQSQRPTPTPKRKILSRTTPGQSNHQASLRQCCPPKRVKTYQKHPVYWYLDGNVRIQIANTCFQLHRSILARQSKWFEKIFNPREPDVILHNVEEPYDLTDLDITAEDFEEVLRALDDTNACFQGELPFSKLSSLLRVSTTLEFTTIEKYASNAFSALWSADLANVGIDKIECPTESLALARQCALFPVIKRTLYELVRLSNFGQTKVMPGDVSAISMVRLGPYDKDLLLAAREHLGVAWREALDVDRFPTCVAQQGTADGTGGPAENTPACAATNHALSLVAYHEIIKEYGIVDFEYDPVSGLQVLAAAPWKEKGFCQACVEQRQTYWLKERERIWQKLDDWFEV